MLAHAEDMATRFTGEVRRMRYDYGEQEARSICAQASAREALQLMEDGIEVMPLSLPLSAVVKETLP